ncbi:MAG: neutral/alkaline non-lysosomal ceramidase N-terminal domain-containing protein [Planctomycetaceae bacterium]|nr:neutral/alkaline non-lysosomal ceramidase N-terminal domain-containing protein [Planctomycetaceae bacterium]
MTTIVRAPQSGCRIGIARCDITPPIGIYHRMWGAALHDRATGIHRPLTATALCISSDINAPFSVILSLDHCILDGPTFARLRRAASLPRSAVLGSFVPCDSHVCLTHTHGSGWLSASRSNLPGGELIEPYLDELADKCARLARQAEANSRRATIIYGTGRCGLAAHRDFRDPATGRYVCGFNPDGPADDTLLVARIVATDDGTTLGTVVNYACHPTTLAWQNSLISPDYLGAMREVVERETEAPCLFLQGASGDLGPREGFVGEPEAADANGRQLGYAVLAALEALPPAGTQYVYSGPVVSGATLGTWCHQSWEPCDLLGTGRVSVSLPYRLDLPSLEQSLQAHERWQSAEAEARQGGDESRVRDCRAQVEQMTRQIARLEALPKGAEFPYRFDLLVMGDSFWIFCPGELYQAFQTTLRARFPEQALIIATIANDWQPGYIPTADSYGKGIYQEALSPLAAGGLEKLIDAAAKQIALLIEVRSPSR